MVLATKLDFLGRIGGGYWFTDTDVRCSDIEYCVSLSVSPEIWKIKKKDSYSDKLIFKMFKNKAFINSQQINILLYIIIYHCLYIFGVVMLLILSFLVIFKNDKNIRK